VSVPTPDAPCCPYKGGGPTRGKGEAVADRRDREAGHGAGVAIAQEEKEPGRGVVDDLALRRRPDAGGGAHSPQRSGRGLLPVFSFEEEAELFVWFAEPGGGWRVRESRCGELASVLCGPCKGVRGVALDPLPRMLEDGTFALVRVGRERFLGRILAQERRTAPERLTHS
jgi:hypothetical protein